ncbi:MAG: hypothetical protein LBF17_02170 [Mediterranea sp.]|nr:hypothetical protein [Mediterranea sp.]
MDVDDKVWNFAHTDAIETFTAPQDGTYRIDVWGGEGGGVISSGGSLSSGRLGNYAGGDIELKENDVLYVCVGSKAVDTDYKTRGAIGKNPGGGSGGLGGPNATNEPVPSGGSGGAASDVRTSNTDISGINLELDENKTVDTRIIVAGGGGGKGQRNNVNSGGQAGANGANGGTGDAGGPATNSGHGGGGGYRGGNGGSGQSQQGNSGLNYVDGSRFTNIVQYEGVRSGDGLVSITLLPI